MTDDPRAVLEVLADLVAERLAARGAAPSPAAASSSAWLDPEALAERLGKHVDTVREMLRAGTLPGRKVGRSWRTSPEDLARFLDGRAAASRQDRHQVATADSWLKAQKRARRAGA
jgi:excisionase family DNA binding protein